MRHDGGRQGVKANHVSHVSFLFNNVRVNDVFPGQKPVGKFFFVELGHHFVFSQILNRKKFQGKFGKNAFSVLPRLAVYMRLSHQLQSIPADPQFLCSLATLGASFASALSYYDSGGKI